MSGINHQGHKVTKLSIPFLKLRALRGLWLQIGHNHSGRLHAPTAGANERVKSNHDIAIRGTEYATAILWNPYCVAWN